MIKLVRCYDLDQSALKNLKICPSVANPKEAGHQRCAREAAGGGGGSGGGSNSGGVTRLHTIPS